MNNSSDKIKKKVQFQSDLAGVKKWKAYLDEEYSEFEEILMKLGSLGRQKPSKRKKNTSQTLLGDNEG